MPVAPNNEEGKFPTDLGYNPLSLEILRRSLEGVKALSRKQQIPYNRTIDAGSSRPDYVSLALDWPEGLGHLVRMAYNPFGAIRTAFQTTDDKSLSVLCTTCYPLFAATDPQFFGSSDWRTFKPLWLFTAAVTVGYRASTHTLISVAVREFKRRRDDLKALALEHLMLADQAKYDLLSEAPLDARAPEVFEALTNTTKVPVSLDCCSMASAYDFEIESTRGVPIALALLNMLYDSGFKAVDLPNTKGHTPLFVFCTLAINHVLDFKLIDDFLEVFIWFLRRGASPTFRPATRSSNDPPWPNILFYLAALVNSCNYRRLMVSWAEPTRIQLQLDYSDTDGCICFCSEAGCLPPKLLWACGHMPASKDCSRAQLRNSDSLEWAMRLLSITAAERDRWYADICRLELFERLGMAHTCCATAGHRSLNAQAYQTPSEDEQRRLRDEDFELARYLDLFMVEYYTASAAYGDKDDQFRSVWWEVIDQILPPLTKKESCRNHLVSQWKRGADPEGFRKLELIVAEGRASCEREVLARNGYAGLDFEEVIRRHFSVWRPILRDLAWISDSDTNSDSEVSGLDERTDRRRRGSQFRGDRAWRDMLESEILRPDPELQPRTWIPSWQKPRLSRQAQGRRVMRGVRRGGRRGLERSRIWWGHGGGRGALL